LRSSGARKGTVPKIVAYYKLYFDTTLLLPTSQSLIAKVFEFITKIFSGFTSQCALLIYSSEAKAVKI